MVSKEAPVKVLYVVGHGRSGSTMLDLVLGNHPDVKSGGEMANLFRKGWLGGGPCSCGLSAQDCPFWSDVRREWAARIGADPVRKYVELQGTFERYKWFGRVVALERRRPSGAFKEYARLSTAFYQAVRSVSGKPVIVDSSKNQMRALALSMMPGVDASMLHLVRDARGVAAARKKSFPKDEKAGVLRDIRSIPVWRSSARWVGTNLLSDWVRRQVGPGKNESLRYEEFVADPKSTLTRVGRTVGLDLSSLGEAVASGEPMTVDHIYGGNRLRMSETITLRDDTRGWRQKLSPEEQRLSWGVAGWLMSRHGYTK